MGRVIVTFARGWQALALTRSLGRRDIEVYCGEEAPFAPSFFSRYCKGSFRYPSFATDPEGFLDAMEEQIVKLKPAEGEPYVLMPVHRETWLFAKHRERFEKHITLPVTDYEKMELVHDKGRLPDLANKLRIPIPPTHRFASIDDLYRGVPDIRFPVFCKVREGASGVGIKKCNTPEELTLTFREFVEGYALQPDEYPLIQEFVKGRDYCVTALFNKGRPVARMSYGNLRQFPRETGASALRETVPLPEAEAMAEKLLASLNWHGIAELDFRQGDDGKPYLIEVNPRFFGGLSQAVASNVDYPYLLYRIAAGLPTEEPDIDYDAKTEVPLTGLIATLDEIARDERTFGRFKKVAEEAGKLARSDVRSIKLRPLFSALVQAGNVKDMGSFVAGKLGEHQGTINDVIHSDDPLPALGALYPVALMLRHGKLNMGLLTSEEEISKEKPRRSFRDMLLRPRWSTLLLTAGLLTLSNFLTSWEYTRDNIGWVLGWSLRVAAKLFGETHNHATPVGALVHTVSHVMNLLFLYVTSALILRQMPGPEDQAEQLSPPRGDS